MNRKHLISLLLVCLSPFLFSQYQIRNYYSLTGKKDVPVYVITQDHDGFLWLGTQDGVYRFDGKTAENPLKAFPQLRREVNAIFMDSQSRLWIGMKSGKVYFSKQNRLDSLNFSYPGNTSRITSFCELGSRVFIGTYGNGLFIFKDGGLTHMGLSNGLSDDVVYKLCDDNASRLWCATDAGITELNYSGAKVKTITISDKNGLPDNIVRDLTLTGNRLNIAMQDSGLCFYDLNTRTFSRKTFFSEWSLGALLTVYSETEKTVLATESQGLFIIKHSNLTVFDYPSHLQCQNIQQAFVDREQQIWIASKRGLTQFTEKRYEWIGKKDGLENEKVLALAVDNDQSLWMGSSSGITRLSKDEKGKLHAEALPRLSKYSITCATKAPDGDIWFGTYGQGIIVLNTKSGNSIVLNTGEDQISDNNISHINFADQRTLYISTLGGGLIKASVNLDGETKVFKVDRVFTEKDGLGSNYIYASVTDSDGVLFAATDGGGLQKLEESGFVNLTAKFRMNSNTAYSLSRDTKNHIWAISSDEGLICYDGKSILKFGSKEGLRDAQPQQIICAGNYLYSIHNKGIDRIQVQDKSLNYFDVNNEEIEPNLNAVIFHNNTLYSGTGNGILKIRTSREVSDSIAPKIHFRAVELNYKPLNYDSANTFAHNLNSFGFMFDGIWMKDPGKLHFRYRLQGFDEEWNLSDEGKKVMYNNLSPGYYTFIAQAQNEEDIWSQPLTYSFMIETPFWKRWWFWVLCLGGISTGIYLFLRYRLRALQKENIILEFKVKERTAQIENQAKIIAQKNKDITDSISYARKIQTSILPANAFIEKHLPESFVFYLTKDIVSGDFYWFTHFNNTSIIAAVDCTGHGVPGAFMSLIGYNLLNRIVNEQKITQPGEILLALNQGVIDALYKNETESKDGMDIAICKIDHNNKQLEYAGAMRPLWIIENNDLKEIKADKIPIGTKQKDRTEPIRYNTHKLPLKGSSHFYIFTDGYADQFGGPREKKYSTGKFKELLLAHHQLEHSQQANTIRDEHHEWKGPHEQVDDILIMGFKL